MSAVAELDSVLKDALKLLHSPSPDSAAKIRLALDEIIKQRHGSSKTITNNLSQKYLAEEENFPSIKRHKSSDSRSSIGRNVSPLSQELSGQSEPVTLSLNVSDIKAMDVSEEENLKEFGDLACVVCRAMVFTAGNRLIECAECHSLYHQECHEPNITDDDANEQEFSWCCASCKNKVIMAKAAAITSVPSPSKSSSSSSSSSSSTSNHKNYEISSKTKSGSKSNSSSKNHFGSAVASSVQPAVVPASSTSSSKHSSSTVTPNINIISADKRLQIMKKKAAKQQESKRKHK